MSINEELIDDSDRREAEVASEEWYLEFANGAKMNFTPSGEGGWFSMMNKDPEYIEEQLDRQNDEIKDALAESYYE